MRVGTASVVPSQRHLLACRGLKSRGAGMSYPGWPASGSLEMVSRPCWSCGLRPQLQRTIWVQHGETCMHELCLKQHIGLQPCTSSSQDSCCCAVQKAGLQPGAET